jgi:hypothetical protein
LGLSLLNLVNSCTANFSFGSLVNSYLQISFSRILNFQACYFGYAALQEVFRIIAKLAVLERGLERLSYLVTNYLEPRPTSAIDYKIKLWIYNNAYIVLEYKSLRYKVYQFMPLLLQEQG